MKASRSRRHALALVLAATMALGTAGCAQPAPTTPTTTESAAAMEEASSVVIRDAWVKAADSGMSAAFGVLVNDGDEDVRIVASTCGASPIMELHETVENADGQMIMREKDGGFVLPAHSEYLLEPGANHLMLMDIVDPVEAGETISFALEFEDGSVYEFDAPAKDYAGANETYVDE
ncbi:copper chaperone PCu(A)C [Microbacterium sp.]|uniref:copper chaperone PCu(A)C n=1 Tax=Microbacterium sp. TaxID=51671 RepID=UPI003A8C8039